MLVPMLPAVELNISLAVEEPSGGDSDSSSGGGTSYSYTYVTIEGDGSLTITDGASIGVAGNINGANFNGQTDITVEGDWYVQDYQFNPKVAELWSGNNVSSETLWQPYKSDIPAWIIQSVMRDNGYAILYDGFFDLKNIGSYKPFGVTRFGEVLGYDTYAKEGEVWDDATKANGGDRAGYSVCQNDEPVSHDWAIMNAYRAVGVEKVALTFTQLHKYTDITTIAKIVGTSKLHTEYDAAGNAMRVFDINSSPIIQQLTGNISPDFDGDEYPVVQVFVTRTDPQKYLEQKDRDMLDFEGGTNSISLVEFCTLVADLMEYYGEPVITEMEEYMLLEAYGRKLPYELFPKELDAVKYLMVRGIIDDPEYIALQSGRTVPMSWYEPVDFETACTILMRVKDTGSRLTFKEFQLTTDLNLLKQGYYPVDVAVTENLGGIYINPLDYMEANAATHYDYFIRRADNRALFLSADEFASGTSVQLETAPHVSTGYDVYSTRLPNSYYRGRTSDGWYWFQVPIDSKDDVVYINSAHSANDNPAQYSMEKGGGYYIVNDTVGDVLVAERIDGFGVSPYVSRENFTAAAERSTLPTAGITSYDKNRTTVYSVQISRRMVYDKPTATSKLDLNGSPWITTVAKLPNYGIGNEEDALHVWVKLNSTTPLFEKPTEDGYVECTLWVPQNTMVSVDEYFSVIVKAKEPITKAMAQTALNLFDNGITAGLASDNSPVRTMRAYCRYGDEYLVSTQYLRSVGAIKEFIHYGENEYYMSVPAYDNNNVPDIDVYFKLNQGDKHIIIFGSIAYIYDASTIIVNQMGDDTFIPASAVSGRLGGNADITLNSGEVLLNLSTPRVSSKMAKLVSGGQEVSKVSILVCDILGDDARNGTDAEYRAFIDLSEMDMMSNYIAVIDKRNGQSAPVVYSLFETGAELQGSQKAQSDIARASFESVFGLSIGGSSVYYAMIQGTPESSMELTKTGLRAAKSMQGDSTVSSIWYSPEGNVLIQIPMIGQQTTAGSNHENWYLEKRQLTGYEPNHLNLKNVEFEALTEFNGYVGGDEILKRFPDGVNIDSYWRSRKYMSYIVPYICAPVVDYSLESGESRKGLVRAGYVYSWLTNWYNPTGTPLPVALRYSDDELQWAERSEFKLSNIPETEWQEVSSEGSVHMQVCGLPALIAGFTVGRSTDGAKLSEILTSNVRATTLFFGCDRTSTAIDSNEVPLATTYYVMHISASVLALQLWGGELRTVESLESTGGLRGPSWESGEPNKITDWLLWLKEAKLSDAEDVLTICIIAILQWVPRIFMFIFFVLMGLSMIASAKPWIIFCDRYFDPYKFLTAGRMDVHTIEIKKVVICSMIALILFGFFQNGLILDIIAWCARAVTGILNR